MARPAVETVERSEPIPLLLDAPATHEYVPGRRAAIPISPEPAPAPQLTLPTAPVAPTTPSWSLPTTPATPATPSWTVPAPRETPTWTTPSALDAPTWTTPAALETPTTTHPTTTPLWAADEPALAEDVSAHLWTPTNDRDCALTAPLATTPAPSTPSLSLVAQDTTPEPPVAPAAADVAPVMPATSASPMPGRRARREGSAGPDAAPAPTLVSVANVRAADPMPTVELPALRDIQLATEAAADTSTTLRAVGGSGKRRAGRGTQRTQRNPLIRALPSMPVAVGVATLAVSIGGVVTTTSPQLAASANHVTSPNAVSGSFGSGVVGERTDNLSRDNDRDALEQAAGSDLVAEAERTAEERNSALGKLAQAAEKEAAEIALNKWVLPIDPGIYRLTATYGEYGLWSSYHTGLDFAAPSGTSLRAVANGVITSTGYDGAYGNKTVLTLEDGTELWFCHQSDTTVSVGDTVRAGELIGYVGSTGNVTGPHLHLEVRPGGGDPVDPYAALRQNGVTP